MDVDASFVEIAPEFPGTRRHYAHDRDGYLPIRRPLCDMAPGLPMRTPAEWRAVKRAELPGWPARQMCPRCVRRARGVTRARQIGESARLSALAG